MIATAADDKIIMLWSYKDSKCILECSLTGHGGIVNSLAFHRDMLISVSEDMTIRVWDTTTRE
jgi:WD40 repeat protein